MTAEMMQLPLPFSACQRWRHGRNAYRPAGEVFDPRHAEVQPIGDDLAKPFILQHRYAASYPAGRFRAGIFVKLPFQNERLCDMAVFSQPMTQAVIPA